MSIADKRKSLIAKKLNEMGNKGIRERTEDDLPFFDRPVEEPMNEPPAKATDKPRNTEESQTDKATPAAIVQNGSFEDYQSIFLSASRPSGEKSGFTIHSDLLRTLRHVLRDLDVPTTLTAYIENILWEHLREYQHLLNQAADERRRHKTIEL